MPDFDLLWRALVMGAVQGATEFIPISSSAHLIILPELWHWPPPSVAFDVLVHLATLVAVFVYFADEWRKLALGVFQWLRGGLPSPLGSRSTVAGDNQTVLPGRSESTPAASATAESRTADARLGLLLIVGTIPGVVGGLLLKGYLDNLLAAHPRAAARESAIELMITGLILMTADRVARQVPRPLSTMTIGNALTIGTAQAVAIMPGISRSAATIAAGQALGFSRSDAARYSFMLSAPIILGANLVKLDDLLRQPPSSAEAAALALGFVASLVVGLASLRWLMKALSRSRLSAFAVYCLLAGAGALILLR